MGHTVPENPMAALAYRRATIAGSSPLGQPLGLGVVRCHLS